MTKYNSSLVVEVSGSLKIPNWWEKTLFTCFIYLFFVCFFLMLKLSLYLPGWKSWKWVHMLYSTLTVKRYFHINLGSLGFRRLGLLQTSCIQGSQSQLRSRGVSLYNDSIVSHVFCIRMARILYNSYSLTTSDNSWRTFCMTNILSLLVN